MKISIFGLGYVGAVAAACIAEQGIDVIAVDTDAVKVKCLQEGRAPIVEPDLTALIKKAVDSGRLKATSDARQAVMNSTMSLICVGTPSDERGALKLDFVETVCREIGAVLKDKKEFHSVVLRSTVVPGTARRVAIPALSPRFIRASRRPKSSPTSMSPRA